MERIKLIDHNEFKCEIGYKDYIFLYGAYTDMHKIADLCKAEKNNANLGKRMRQFMYLSYWIEKEDMNEDSNVHTGNA